MNFLIDTKSSEDHIIQIRSMSGPTLSDIVLKYNDWRMNYP